MNSVNSPAVPSLVREINERRALEILRTHGALHAAEIARLVGLSRPTTADILRDLVENPDLWTLGIGLTQFESLHHVDRNMLMTASALFMMPVIVIFFFSQKVFIEGVTLTGVKG